MERSGAGLVLLVMVAGCATLLPPALSPPPARPAKYTIDEPSVSRPIKKAILVGSSREDAESWLRQQGFKAPPNVGKPWFCGPPPHVRIQHDGNTAIRTEVRLHGTDRVEKLDVEVGYSWGVPEDAFP